MNRSTKTRFAIFQILAEVFKKNKNFETVLNQIVLEQSFNKKKKSLSLIMYV